VSFGQVPQNQGGFGPYLPIRFQVQVSAARRVNREEIVLFDAERALIAAERVIIRMIEGHFEGEFGGDASGRVVKWPPLAEATRQDRLLLGYPPDRPMLVREGTFKREMLGDDPEIETSGEEAAGPFRITPRGTLRYRPRISNLGKFRGLSARRPSLGLTRAERDELRRVIFQAGTGRRG
jgi:hypothetical protein